MCVACRGHAGPDRALCPACRAGVRWLGGEWVTFGPVEVWAPVAYEGAARALVRALKYRGAMALADPMAAAMAANAPPGLREAAALVPVPLVPARRRRRGFNQAEVLARALGARTGLPVVDCLGRSGNRGAQVGRGRTERREPLDDALAAKPGAPRLSAAIIVDDVVTTGTTLAACCHALRASGCERVRAVTYARTLGR
jgi:ComF family protein